MLKVRAVEFERAGQNGWFLRLLQAWAVTSQAASPVLNSMFLFVRVHLVKAYEKASMRFASNDAGMQRRHWLVKLCAFLTAVLGPARQLQVRSSEGELNRRSNDITIEWPTESKLSPG